MNDVFKTIAGFLKRENMNIVFFNIKQNLNEWLYTILLTVLGYIPFIACAHRLRWDKCCLQLDAFTKLRKM